MVFSSLLFLFRFLPLVFLLYYLTPRRGRNVVLFLFSLFFYAWGEPKYVFLMLFSITMDYTVGRLIDKAKREGKPGKAKGCLLFSVFMNLAILGFFKYADFIISSINAVSGLNLPLLNIPLPIGISFFTFQTMSYTIDVYRGNTDVQKNWISYGTYVSMFPQLIAGPIVQYKTIAKQMKERRENLDDFTEGIHRFVTGVGKKVLLANNIGLLWDAAAALPVAELPVATAWLGALAYTFQIYFDFSGYSDMAIGLGKMFGFHFLENFNYPYISGSVREFWRRWHISLSSWFRDYLYIPLGGSRKGAWRTYWNLFIVFFVTGLWHGASYNFILWGLFHGMFLVLERWKLGAFLERIPQVFRHIYTLLIVMIAWVFFRAETLPEAGQYLLQMVNVTHWNWNAVYTNINPEQVTFMILGILFSLPVVDRFTERFVENGRRKQVWNSLYLAVVGGVFILSICYMTGSGFNPFIYFRF